MNQITKLNVLFMGGKQAGCVGLLTVLALGHKVKNVVGYGNDVKDLALALGIPTHSHLKTVSKNLKYDILICVHGREIVPAAVLEKAKYGGINVHPCLSKYKGGPKSPVTRAIENKDLYVSVGVHKMTSKVDEGRILVELVTSRIGNTEDEVYNHMYPLYSLALIHALEQITA